MHTPCRARPWLALCLVAFLPALRSGAQQLRVSPFAAFPLGTDADYFGAALGADCSFGFGLPLTLLGASPFAAPALGFASLPVEEIDLRCSAFSAGGQAGLAWTALGKLVAELSLGGGYYRASASGDISGIELPEPGGGAWYGAEAAVGWRILPALELSLGGGYRDYAGLARLASIRALAAYRFGEPPAPRQRGEASPAKLPPAPAAPPKAQPLVAAAASNGELALAAAQLPTVFPVFFAWYDDHPVGSLRVRNVSGSRIEELRVSFYVKQYMDNPKAGPALAALEPGAEAEIPLYALFSNKILEESEGSKVSASLSLEYLVKGKRRKLETVETLSLYDRNAIRWDDDRKVAAFVTAKDQAVLSFAKAAAGAAPANPAADQKLLLALAVHEALRLYGIRYVVDPASSYAALSAADAVDFLQFPRQTLEFKAGDCDDLTALYCALLEAAGAETAFVTVPGHIYAAVALGTDPEATRRAYRKSDDFIYAAGKAWLPLEVTMRDAGFLEAWQEGAKEWIEAGRGGKAALYPVREAWAAYKPVAFPGSLALAQPAAEKVAAAAEAQLGVFLRRELAASLAAEQLSADTKDPRKLNRAGILYARSGLYAEAAAYFERSLKQKEGAPALLNLGNIESIKKNWETALGYFDRAARLEPASPAAALAQARAHHALENYGSAKAAYERLLKLDPALAGRYAYLELRGEEAARAALAGGAEAILWEDYR
ncbi:MAG TPA: tetratricopeptide repeat protein [Spirochaetales bacterium]|nr:tetratricopeptide repeat protein [Spirochaetales bacterium]HRY54038.1 tetratricopeptide repeat protein [Spirochaetia bacterium]HRZ63418.1 tetratricopeptide repeat protein [Spirochaetia bacterium]